MGWSSGASILADTLKIIEPHVPKKRRKIVWMRLMELFEDYDADTLCEINDPLVQEIMNEWYPEEDEDE